MMIGVILFVSPSDRHREGGRTEKEKEGVCRLAFQKGKMWLGREEARALLHFMGIPQSEETVIKMQCGREGGRGDRSDECFHFLPSFP